MSLYYFLYCSTCASAPDEVTALYPVDASQWANSSCSQYVSVSWTQSSSGVIDSYLVQCVSSLDQVNNTYPSTARNAILGPLIAGIEYNCSVAAVNDFGVGQAAFADPFTTL